MEKIPKAILIELVLSIPERISKNANAIDRRKIKTLMSEKIQNSLRRERPSKFANSFHTIRYQFIFASYSRSRILSNLPGAPGLDFETWE